MVLSIWHTELCYLLTTLAVLEQWQLFSLHKWQLELSNIVSEYKNENYSDAKLEILFILEILAQIFTFIYGDVLLLWQQKSTT